jgi:hypothetical protein
MPQLLPCPICSLDSPTEYRDDHSRLVNCRRCANYALSEDLDQALVEHRISQNDRAALMAGIRAAARSGDRVEVTRATARGLIGSVRPPADPMEAGDDILRYLRARTTHFSARVPLEYDYDYPLFALKNREELAEVIAYLTSQHYVSVMAGNPPEFWISFEGYQRLRELDKVPQQARQIFVAMSFAESLREAYEAGIAPAIREHRYQPVRMDRVEHNDRIDDRIIAEIRRSAAIVADFSGLRSGVFFEAGVALGLGLPIIWTCHATDFESVSNHFDTRQFNHIRWSSPAELRTSLKARMGATIAVGPLSIDPSSTNAAFHQGR